MQTAIKALSRQILDEIWNQVDGNRNTIWAICQEFLQPDDGLS